MKQLTVLHVWAFMILQIIGTTIIALLAGTDGFDHHKAIAFLVANCLWTLLITGTLFDFVPKKSDKTVSGDDET